MTTSRSTKAWLGLMTLGLGLLLILVPASPLEPGFDRVIVSRHCSVDIAGPTPPSSVAC